MTSLLTGRPLDGRIAVVTGASSGMGAATARRLAELGARVALIARRKDKLTVLAADITTAGGTALALPLDVTDRAAVQAAAGQVSERLGQADLVFNNAGVQLISAIDELKVDEWQQQIDLNITGVMNVIAAFIPHLTAAAERGGPAGPGWSSSLCSVPVLALLMSVRELHPLVSHFSLTQRAGATHIAFLR